MRHLLALFALLIALPVLAAETPAPPAVTAKDKPPEVMDYFRDANHKMHEAMTAPATGNIDVDFARGMIAHHQGAIDMAQVHLKYSKDPELRTLSQKIIDAQGPEIAQMQLWLDRHPQKK